MPGRSTNTTNPRKNFILEPAIEWKESWLRRCRQTRYALAWVRSAGPPQPVHLSKLLIYWKKRILVRPDFDLCSDGSATDPSLRFHFFVRVRSWADFQSIVGRREAFRQRL